MDPLQCQAAAELHSLASAPLPCTPPPRGFFSSLASYQQGAISRLQSRFYKGTSVRSKLDPLSSYFPAYTHAESNADLAGAAAAVSDDLRAKFEHSMAELRSAKPTADNSPAADINASKSPLTIQLHAPADAIAAAAIQQQCEDLVSAPTAAEPPEESSAETPAKQQENQSSSQQASAINVPEATTGLDSFSLLTSAAAPTQQPQQAVYRRRPSPALAYNAHHAANETSSSNLTSCMMLNAPLYLSATEPAAAVSKAASLVGVVPAHTMPMETAPVQEPSQATEQASTPPSADADSTTMRLPSSFEESKGGIGPGQGLELASVPAANPSNSHSSGQSSPAVNQASAGSASGTGDSSSRGVAHHSTGHPTSASTSATAVSSSTALANSGSAVTDAPGQAPAIGLPESRRVDTTICSHPIDILPEDEDEEETSSADFIEHVEIPTLRLLVLHWKDLASSQTQNDQAMTGESGFCSLARLANAAAFAGAPQAVTWQRGSPYVSSETTPVEEPVCQAPPSHGVLSAAVLCFSSIEAAWLKLCQWRCRMYILKPIHQLMLRHGCMV